MPRFDEPYFQPRLAARRYPPRPQSHEIRIPVRSNGQASRPSREQQPIDHNDHRRSAETAGSNSKQTGSQQGEIERLRQKAAEWKEKYARLAAERENERKRMAKLFATQAEQDMARLLHDMLPLADNLERILHHANKEGENLQTGVELTLKAFTEALFRHGVERIEAQGKAFDPRFHEAVGVIPHPTMEPGSVARVEETGYTYQGKLLRPARVLVVADRPHEADSQRT